MRLSRPIERYDRISNPFLGPVQRVLDVAAMVRALQLLDEEPPSVREAIETLADRVYTNWGGDDATP